VADQNAELNGCTKRRQLPFLRAVTQYYVSHGWSIPSRGKDPSDGYEIHHVLPLSWGGTNAGANGRFLTPTQHDPFTTWWRTFRLDGTFSPGE
jgi:hypothetical protein